MSLGMELYRFLELSCYRERINHEPLHYLQNVDKSSPSEVRSRRTYGHVPAVALTHAPMAKLLNCRGAKPMSTSSLVFLGVFGDQV